MKFKEWFITEAVVETSQMGEAIKQTLQFVVPGQWRNITIKPHQWYWDERWRGKGSNAVNCSGVLHNTKALPPAFFLVNVFGIMRRPISHYDSFEGDPNNLKFVGSVYYFDKPQGDYELVGSLENGQFARSPYELAKWIASRIESFGQDDDDDDDGGWQEQPDLDPSLAGSL